MLLLFPSDYFDIKNVEPDYSTEYDVVSNMPEFDTVLFNYDEFVSDGAIKTYPNDQISGECIYRGWMLTPLQYKALYGFLLGKGIRLINSPEEFNACHLFPTALDLIRSFTPKALSFKDGETINWGLVNRTFARFMIKDFVKSVKGTRFPLYFETPVDPAEMDKRLAEFIDLRGELFTGGIVFKEYVDFKRYNGATNEYRAFFLKGQLLSLCGNSKQPSGSPVVRSDFVMGFRDMRSNYYTIDFGELSDGSWIVIETGDGQVSDLSPGQSASKYYGDIRRIICMKAEG